MRSIFIGDVKVSKIKRIHNYTILYVKGKGLPGAITLF